MMLKQFMRPVKQCLSAWLNHPSLVAAFVFLICGMRHLNLPGLYMDAVNPDYLAAHALHPQLDNFRFLLPGSANMVLLGNYYHGVQNYYLDRLFLRFFGVSVVNIRLAQMLFGCIIVAACAALVRRLTHSNIWAMFCGLCLATDVAFIGSFRNQNYIVLGGFAWLCVSLLFVVAPRVRPLDFRKALLSGIFSGLAAYGYFVLIFFYPAVLGVVVSRVQKKFKGALVWCVGVAIGLLPYVIGYWKMYRALGSFAAFKTSVSQGITGLNPAGHASNLLDRVHAVLQFAQLALSGGEENLMAFGQSIPNGWGEFKPYLLVIVVVALLTAWCYTAMRRRQTANAAQFAWLPVSFAVVAAAAFGGRLGAHHFSVMTPLLYVLLAIVLATAVRGMGKSSRWRNALVVMAFVVFIGANLAQQDGYMSMLGQTGGVGKSSSALTTMAEEAYENGQDAIYVFPDWGFFTSFALLTENTVPYVVDTMPTTLYQAAQRFPTRKKFRLAYWDQSDTKKYTDAMLSAGISSITERDFHQLDGPVAFHMLEGNMIGAPLRAKIRQ